MIYIWRQEQYVKEENNMVTVCEKDQCAGCMACLEVCSKNAINIKDSIKSYNAIIDEKRCINCNACRNICQVNNNVDMSKPIMWKQGWASDVNIRKKSSSGGAAAAIARSFVENEGILCSCCFSQGEFVFDFEDDMNKLARFSGSKYVKSNPKGVYRKIKQLLQSGKKVLFIGLPCQVAAVKSFVGKRCEEKLYTIDLICHGSPSPMLLERFLNEKGYNIKQIGNIEFRSKTNFALKGKRIRLEPVGVQDLYTYAFLTCMDYTDNCYSCKYARLERVSDISIGDSWGSDIKEEEKKGISLILCQTEKGIDLLEQSKMTLEAVDLERAVASNHQLKHPSKPAIKRDKFITLLQKGKRFDLSFFMCHPKVVALKQIDRINSHLKNGGGTKA